MSNTKLFDPEAQKAACSVGFIAHEDGRTTRKNIDLALVAAENMQHRTAVGADGRTSDGSGLNLVRYSKESFITDYAAMGGQLAEGQDLAVGNIFLPRDNAEARGACKAVLEQELKTLGYDNVLWKDMEIDTSVLGEMALASMPKIEEIYVPQNTDVDAKKFRDDLIVARRRAEKIVHEQGLATDGSDSFYVCSLSPSTIVYKGLTTTPDTAKFFKRLQDPELKSAGVIIHGRYATNTLPNWRLAQPFRGLAHNGEINTIRGNRKAAELHAKRYASRIGEDVAQSILPLITPGNSDSASSDEFDEYLKLAGVSGPTRKVTMMPESLRDDVEMDPDYRQALEYLDVTHEDYGGPATWIVASDGFDEEKFDGVFISNDRNGLRPVRKDVAEYTDENGETVRVVFAGSESGAANDPRDPAPIFVEENMIEHGNLRPGEMFGVQFPRNGQSGYIVRDAEFKKMVAHELTDKHLVKNIIQLDDIEAQPEDYNILQIADKQKRKATIQKAQRLAGYSRHDIRDNILKMGSTGAEPLASMGDDRPLAGFSGVQRSEADHFKQNFAQVSNPPIDSVREEGAMSLKTSFGSFYGANGKIATDAVIQKEHPYLTNGMHKQLAAMWGEDSIAEIDATFDLDINGEGLKASMDRIAQEAVAAMAQGKHVILSDQNASDERTHQLMLFTTAAVSKALGEAGLYGTRSLNIRTAKGFDTHYHAMLLANGATSTNFYLAEETLAYEHSNNRFTPFTTLEGLGSSQQPDLHEIIAHNVKALNKGLLAVMAKMGVADLASYRNANLFSLVGVSQDLIDELYPNVGLKSPIGGLGFKEFEKKERYFFAENLKKQGELILPPGSNYNIKGSESHANTGFSIGYLGQASRTGKPEDFTKYKEEILRHTAQRPDTFRDSIDIDYEARTPISIDEVEPAKNILKRMIVGGMSHGSISPEVKRALVLACRELGVDINSGEGSIPENLIGTILQETSIQAASGRFGNSTDYMVAPGPDGQIQKKNAQGAKPGEGGHLVGKKVLPHTAKNRGVGPGTPLVSPPPNHSTYSIEDELEEYGRFKEVNAEARVSSKLVSDIGVGNIAVGCVKGGADDVVIAGGSGGTGAAKQSSINNAGLPWELGVAEANQGLTTNGLRERATLTVSGGIRPLGFDAVKAFLLGADKIEIGLPALQALGCLVLKKCHTNTCPVGIATQDPKLRDQFPGEAIHLMNMYKLWVEDIRVEMARLGFKNVNEMIGHTDLLKQTKHAYNIPWFNHGDKSQPSRISLDQIGFDFGKILAPANDHGPALHCELKSGERSEYQDPSNPDRAITFDRKYLADNAENYKTFMSNWRPGDAPLILSTGIRNFERQVGVRLSGINARQFNDKVSGSHLPVHIMLKGQAGNSLGAYNKGERIELEGVANDFVGLGLTNGKIVIYPNKKSIISQNTQDNIILGNIALYGAVGGELYAAGGAGNRFAILNHGATAVVESVQDYGCNYMTAGKVLILGETGTDFASGYSGGDIVVFDPNHKLGKRLHQPSAELQKVQGTISEQWAYTLLKQHVEATGSKYAENLLREWDSAVANDLFVNVRPKIKPHYDPAWENMPDTIEFPETDQKLPRNDFI